MPWEHAGPFGAPGRWRAQETLERGLGGRVFVAGDWVSDFVSMETAALTAVDASAEARALIERGGPSPRRAAPNATKRDAAAAALVADVTAKSLDASAVDLLRLVKARCRRCAPSSRRFCRPRTI